MPRSPVFWSAQSCRFRNAGVYYGLSEAGTHVRVAKRLLPRRGVSYQPGAVALQKGRSVPLVYIAVRDPSAVRVVPVRDAGNGEKANGHVSLVFPSNPRPAANVQGPALSALERIAEGYEQAGFVVSVGLKTDREQEFHRRVVLENMGLAYSELCDVITALRDEFSD